MVRQSLLIFAIVTTASPAAAADSAGRVVALSGKVFLERADAGRVQLARGDYLFEGDAIATGEDGNVRLLMRDKSVLALAPKSGIAITAYDVRPESKRRRASLTVLVGRLWAFVSRTDNPEATYEVKASTAVAGVRGTELVFDVDDSGNSAVTVIGGEVELASKAGKETIGVKQTGSVKQGDIELAAASDEKIADIRGTITPEQELDEKSAGKRMKKTRKKSGAEAGDGVARKESGSGDAMFEDLEGAGGGGDGSLGGQMEERADAPDLGGTWNEGFGPSALVRLRVEVRQ